MEITKDELMKILVEEISSFESGYVGQISDSQDYIVLEYIYLIVSYIK